MEKRLFGEILEDVRHRAPVVHCITNYVTVNDCANVLLACGASPIMADDEDEVEEITKLSSALNLNIGTLNKRTVKSMYKAAKVANDIDIPVILDPVGAGASALRTETALNLISDIKISVIRGNMSEIRALARGYGVTRGVDANAKEVVTENNLVESIEFVKKLSEKLNAVIAATGAIDLIADAKGAYIVRNGVEMLSRITGSGCMLSALTAAFCSSNKAKNLESATASVLLMGQSGEIAYRRMIETKGGHGLFSAYLIDEIGKAEFSTFIEGMKVEFQ